MGILRKIKEIFTNIQADKVVDNSFIYPYSVENNIKRQEIWTNLQKGILFEDNQVLIPWLTPYFELVKFSEQRREKGDRTNWFLGKHIILDNYECSVENMKYSFTSSSEPFSKIEEFLGFDEKGNEKFIFLKTKLTNLLGQPTINKPEKFYDYDIGTFSWTNGKIEISICGFEQFACKYWLTVGLKTNKQTK